VARDIIINSDFSPELNDVVDATGAAITGATVTYTLYTAAGVAVSGATGTCSHVSSGDYRGTLESTYTSLLTAGASYYFLYVLSSSGTDFTFRSDHVAQNPGATIVDPSIFTEFTGVTASAGAELTALSAICQTVAELLERKCYPALIAPKALTLFAFDAPPTDKLLLPRPVRSISAIYYHPGANGDSSELDLTADLLTNYTQYYSPPDDVLTGWNRSGVVLRRPQGMVWGWEHGRHFGTLAPVVDPNKGAVFVSGSFGPDRVPHPIRMAAVRAVTLLYNSRVAGMPFTSESWNGRSQSTAQNYTAEAAVNSPDVLALLRDSGLYSGIHFG
jgi:hypothetical protein